MPEEIVNRVAQSGIINLDPADFYPKFEITELDIKPWLFQGLLLKEKDFRQHLVAHNWQQYEGKHVAVFCSADAIIPQWAYMLLASHLQPTASGFSVGTSSDFTHDYMMQAISEHDYKQYLDARVILKGCGDYPIPDFVYLELTKRLVPVAKSVMFGEACSTVPIYKKKK